MVDGHAVHSANVVALIDVASPQKTLKLTKNKMTLWNLAK